MQKSPESLNIPDISLSGDQWRMTARNSPDDPGPGRGRDHAHLRKRVFGLLALVVLADVLFWGQSPGLSLAIFAFGVFAFATADLGQQRAAWRAALLLALGVAPVVEHVQPLSVTFLVGSLLAALVWARRPAVGGTEIAAMVVHRVMGLPAALLSPLAAGVRSLRSGSVPGSRPQVAVLARNWAFPLGGTLVLAALLMQANPLIGRFVVPDVDLVPLLQRVLFWLGVGLIVWPLLDRDLADAIPSAAPRFGKSSNLGIHAASVIRALVMFNLLVGVQTLMDLSILIGGADLPEGMSYAAYTRRGAYPLLAAVMLAGAFALAARPFLDDQRFMRPLMLIWLGQNVLLCGAAMLRLDLYIDAYGLTYLRVYALIWMGLVAIGLGTTAWQVWRGRPNAWLIGRAAILGLGTLYACAFVNFAQMIAERNLSGHARVDWSYLCDLGPTAAGPLVSARGRAGLQFYLQHDDCIGLAVPQIAGWRDFTFRSWRVQRYVSPINAVETVR